MPRIPKKLDAAPTMHTARNLHEALDVLRDAVFSLKERPTHVDVHTARTREDVHELACALLTWLRSIPLH